MKNIWLRQVFILILSLIGAAALLFFVFHIEKPHLVQGGRSDNIRGWLWSRSDGSYPGGIGWISLNCYNDYNNDGQPENNCPTNINYGLKLDSSTNKISGYGWSPNVGWICFGETCKCAHCPSCSNYITCEGCGTCSFINSPDNFTPWACKGENVSGTNCLGEGKKVFGWAKVVWSSPTTDGWIKLRGQTTGGISYGLSLEDFGFNHKELTGFAWSSTYNPQITGAGLGWLGAYQSYCLKNPPDQVRNLTVRSVSQNCQSLLLNWQPPTKCAQGYKIYRCRGEGCNPQTNGVLIANISVNEVDCSGDICKWQDVGLSGGQIYRYQVQAWNLNGDGIISDAASGTTVLCAPSQPLEPILSSKCGEITVQWLPVGGAVGYNVYRAVKNKDNRNDCELSQCRRIAENIRPEDVCGESLCAYEDKSIIANVNYHYWVTALSCLEPLCPPYQESPYGYMKSGKSTCLPPTRWQEK
ncbi:MAG: fibronectin type III domain-containing protein [Patescibacteria group bacterium]|nr:fibronectin type III domain-containing protein [Patescibacteria group bacterium]